MTAIEENSQVRQEIDRRGARKRVEPFSIIAEHAVVASMIVHAQARTIAFERPITAGDFHDGKSAALFSAMGKLYAAGSSIDVKTIAEQLRRDDKLKFVGGERGILERTADSVFDATSHVEIIAELAGFRRAIEVGNDLIEAGYSADLDEVSKVLTYAVDRIVGVLDRPDVEPAFDVLDIKPEEAVKREFVVPGLLVAGDRMIVTGGEGGGKSTYLRQLAVQCAAGIHPFTLMPMPARRCVFIDLQDSGAQISREFSKLLDVGDTVERMQPGALVFQRRRQGFDIMNPTDAKWFEETIGNAEIVFVGPLYKTYRGKERVGKHDPSLAEEVTARYDEIIERTGACMLFEAHSPHGVDGNRANLRPDGPARWLAWPEFGHGLLKMKPKDGETEPRGVWLTRFRGDRDIDREWPRSLYFGGPGRWPFLAPRDHLNEVL